MQFIATPFAASHQDSTAPSKDLRTHQAAEAVEAYLRRASAAPASLSQPLPTSAGLFGKLLAYIR